MPKGIYTQGLCVLLERPVSLDELQAVLGKYDVRKRIETITQWELGGPTLVLAYRLEINGLVTVDIVDRPWPDGMGDPQSESMLFAAWTMGHFGPYTYPHGLQRATQQCWAWKSAQAAVEKHRAFIRIRSSYALGAADDQPIVPQEYAPLPELEFVTELASTLLTLPGALCYFNPNGEVLRDREGLVGSLEFAREHELPPLDIWSNVRMYNIDAEWTLMDTVGNAQLDIPDSEACFFSKSYDFNEIDSFLRNVSLYLLKNGEVINDGDTMDGPGGLRWQARVRDNGLTDPPRRVLRWLPMDDREPPEVVLGAGLDDEASGEP